MCATVDAQRLEKYLNKIIKTGGLLEPVFQEIGKININRLSKIGGGTSNNIYTFSLTNYNEYWMQDVELVLKLYRTKERVKCQHEYHILKTLEKNKIPVPKVYIQEINEKFFGAPFIIMEKVKGKSLGNYLNKLPKRDKLDLIKLLADTLVILHTMKLENLDYNIIKNPVDKYYYAKQQPILLRQLKYAMDVKAKFNCIIDWLESYASQHPCHQYSLLHGDMNLNNFIITKKGKLIMIDWENPEIGDALKDVGLAYHNIRMSVYNANEGNEIGRYFIRQYIKSLNKKINYSTLRFYLLSTALQEAICYRFNSVQVLHILFIKQTLGIKYLPAFPLIYLYFRLKSYILERFIVEELVRDVG